MFRVSAALQYLEIVLWLHNYMSKNIERCKGGQLKFVEKLKLRRRNILLDNKIRTKQEEHLHPRPLGEGRRGLG